MAERAVATGQHHAHRAHGLGEVAARAHRRAVGRAAHPRGRCAASAFVPLRSAIARWACCGSTGRSATRRSRDHPDSLLAAFAGEAALGVQRVELAQEAAHAEALRQADEMKTALMTSISHDLKTPLAGIKAAISSLLDDSVDWSEEDRAGVPRDDRFAGRPAQPRDQRHPRPQPHRVGRDRAGARRACNVAIAARRTSRERTRSRRAGRAVDGRRRCATCLRAGGRVADRCRRSSTLIENAAKYSTPGGADPPQRRRRTARASRSSVADDGPGHCAAATCRTSSSASTARRSSSRRVKGSGLGLTIVKGFVDALAAARSRVESSPDGHAVHRSRCPPRRAAKASA